MKIEFPCTSCNSLLRVEGVHAGKKARCGHCGMILDVPVEPTAPLSPAADAEEEDAELNHDDLAVNDQRTSEDRWLMRTPDGNQYGPVTRRELDEWVSEGRVSHECSVRREHDVSWSSALALFPDLAGRVVNPASNFSATAKVPSLAATQTYTPRLSMPASGSQTLPPNHGVLVLIMGILTLTTGGCFFFFALIGLVVGANDLASINRGTMSDEGKPLVIAGMVLSVIGILLSGLWFLACLMPNVR